MTNIPTCKINSFLISLILFVCAESALATPIKVFILGGQSNMRGRGVTNQLTGDLAYLQTPRTDILICSGTQGTPGTVLEDLQPSLASEPFNFGPELQFGHAIADLHPTVNFALIKYAHGGTELREGGSATSSTHWIFNPTGPTDSSYQRFQTTITNGLAELVDLGYEPEIIGMLWHQGESNIYKFSPPQNEDYAALLANFIADVRSIYGANLPFMIGEIARIRDDADEIADQQIAAGAADPYAVFVPAADLEFVDDFHFSTQGYVDLGQRFATYYNDNFSNLITDTSDDFTPPSPATMTWASVPTALSDSEITMTAVTATDGSGVQYNFVCTSDGNRESGWQTSPTFVDTGLTPSTEYTYTVQARDLSVNRNTNTTSAPASATTDAPDLTAPPVPTLTDPAGWTIGSSSITVGASTVVDGEGSPVEYRFFNTTLSTNSGWLSTPEWTDNGLTAETSYTYTVQARDTSTNMNESAQSSSESATTTAAPVGAGGALIYESFSYDDGTALQGNTADTGLLAWVAENGAVSDCFETGSLSFGSLPVGGNRFAASNDPAYSAQIDADLSAVLADGATLWASILMREIGSFGSSSASDRCGLFIGTDLIDAQTGAISNAGDGLGFQMDASGRIFARGFDDGVAGSVNDVTRDITASGSLSADTTYLFVMKMTWGATDTVEIYLADSSDLSIDEENPYASFSGTFEQTSFDTISLSTNNSEKFEADEIRFGASLDDVLGLGSSATGYASWAETNAPTTGNDLTADEDDDGVDNGPEFVLGGSLGVNDSDKLPTLSKSNANTLSFSFQRAQESIDAGLSVVIQVSPFLDIWTTEYIVPDVETSSGVVIVEKDTSVGFDTVTLTLSTDDGDSQFARLQVLSNE